MKLICPKCSYPLIRSEKTCRCENNHCYDFAKEGYINLLLKESVSHGDDANMVKARTSFLHTDSYAFLKDKLCELIKGENGEVLVDLGCGEGYYTSSFPFGEKYGFDLSKHALKYASKHDSTTQYCVSSIFHLPLPDECADVIVTCFAPVAKEEIERLLKHNGCFIVVTPDKNHLIELKELLYKEAYENEVKDIDISLEKENEIHISNTFEVNNDNAFNLFQMTPYAYKTSVEAMNKLKEIDTMKITASFVIRLYRKA